MAIVGLKKSYLGLIDKKTGKIITGPEGLTTDGLYISNSKDYGTASANITNIAAAGTQKFGDNGLVDVVSAKSFPQVAAVWNNLPFAIKAKTFNSADPGFDKVGMLKEVMGGYAASGLGV